MTFRIESRTVALEPAWRLGEGEAWRLGEAPDSTAALLPEPVFVPQLPPPPLEPFGAMPIATGVGLPWNTWTTIREQGQVFREVFRAGAFGDDLKSGNRNMPTIPAFLNHGQDPTAGYKVLGKLQLWEAQDGLRYELAFLDSPFVHDILGGVEAGLYGMSVRFGTLAATVTRNPPRSRINPDGIQEREITRARLSELSVTPIPAYSGTSATLKQTGRL